MILPKKSKHTYLAGGKRWVDNNLTLVLFKHHCLNRFLHKVTYVKAIHKPTKTSKEKAPNQGNPYINLPGALLEEVCNQWIN